MFVPDAVSEVYITDKLVRRTSGLVDLAREKLAVQDIARQMANNPSQVLPTLVDLAIELCGAVAGGISTYERDGGVFRWHHLRGTLERFTGATTPRDYSPCGITLDQKSPILVQKPERAYTWLVDADVSLPECYFTTFGKLGALKPCQKSALGQRPRPGGRSHPIYSHARTPPPRLGAADKGRNPTLSHARAHIR